MGEAQILLQEPLSKHTTFRIGGPCDFFVRIKKDEELCDVLALCKQEAVPYFLIGNGSNLLVCDEGLAGVVLKLEETDSSLIILEETPETVTVSVGAGMNLSAFAMKVAKQSLTGFEFAAGIPGSVGGAVYMNAGAYGGTIKDCLQSVKVVIEDGKIITLDKEELQLGYRKSLLQTKNILVLSAVFTFKRGDYASIRSKIEELNAQRKEKQPLEYPSAGSTFKRPEGYFAGKLIMDAGLRGYRVGNAMVSEKHCGFVINTGGATAHDVCQRMEDVSRIVYEKFGVILEPEVKYISNTSSIRKQ